MRKTVYSAFCALLLTSLVACKKDKDKDDTQNPTQPTNEITDARDGKKYNIVTIGTQTWIASNLRYASSASICPTGDCDTYGVYYTAADAKTACMSGYHLPSDLEWKTLELNQGMLASDTGLTGYRGVADMVGKKLKESGSAGLNLKLSGSNSAGSSDQVGTFGYYWSSTLNPSNSAETYYRSVKSASDGMNRDVLVNGGVNPYYFCIRCLKD